MLHGLRPPPHPSPPNCSGPPLPRPRPDLGCPNYHRLPTILSATPQQQECKATSLRQQSCSQVAIDSHAYEVRGNQNTAAVHVGEDGLEEPEADAALEINVVPQEVRSSVRVVALALQLTSQPFRISAHIMHAVPVLPRVWCTDVTDV